jgi:hypothetical protein
VSEVLAGLVPFESVAERKCPENEAVVYSLRIEPNEQLPLALLEVTVKPVSEQAPATSTKQAKSPAPSGSLRRRDQREREITLRRWVSLPERPNALASGPSSPEVTEFPGSLLPAPPEEDERQ